jgi:membrane-associated protease RseP (regulator of RpoE activity)
MAAVIGILVVLVGILVSIALHEVGHMVPAKKFGVRVSHYFVGFGPTLWSRTKGETEYGLKAIPLGGYVRLVGMYPPARPGAKQSNGFFGRMVQDAREMSAEEILPGQEPRAFYNLSAPKKFVVMFGGPFMNLVIAFVLMGIALVGIGINQPTTTVSTVPACVAPADATADYECTASDPATPAAQAGIEPGDTIVSFDGEPVPSWESFVGKVTGAAGETVPVVVERDGERVTLEITPTEVDRPVVGDDGQYVTDDEGELVLKPAGYVGVAPTQERTAQPLSAIPETIWAQVSGTAEVVVALPAKLVDVVQSTFAGEERDPASVMGPVGVGRIAVDVVGADSVDIVDRVSVMLQLLAGLNIALFVFNLIPLPPLDGGHIAGAVYEGAKRQVARVRGLPRPAHADVAKLVPLGLAMWVVLLGMGVLLIYADIVNPIRIT